MDLMQALLTVIMLALVFALDERYLHLL